VTPTDSKRHLDDPVWSCLTTRHAHFALGDALARRYSATISPIGATSGTTAAHVGALEAIVELGDDIALIGRSLPSLPDAHWETLYVSRLEQMIRVDRSPLPEGDVEVSKLGKDDVSEMLELVELTKPGPFRLRTVELGTYIGFREHGRLIGMAGERMWIGEFREVSAVCTHPDAQGRGYARALIGRVVNRMLRAGETPILHVDCSNTRAIDLYRALGFAVRAQFALLYARHIGS
jgi:ribosomal protein S18 acetylase RimI-like enzyme